MENQPQKTHWKKLQNPDYLGAYDFQPGEQRIATIKNVQQETIKSERGDSQEITVHFVEPYKPMILNATNAKQVAKLSGSNFIEDWKGLSIKIEVKKVKAFGDIVEALRISSDKVVRSLPELIKGTELFDKVLSGYKANKFTMDDVKKRYSVSKEMEDLLNG